MPTCQRRSLQSAAELNAYFFHLVLIDVFIGTSLPPVSSLRAFLNRGLAKNTRANYSKAATVWLEFLWLHGFPTQGPHHPMPYWSTLRLSHQLYVIVSYIKWLHEFKQWETKKIGKHMSGVRDFIRGHLLDLTAFNHETVVLAVKAATQTDSRALSLTRETKKRLPVIVEMVQWLKLRMWRDGAVTDANDIDNRMTFLGITLGLTFLRRVSEYASDSRSDHAIVTDDVHFITRGDFPTAVASFDVRQCKLSVDHVDTIRLIFRTSKTDQGGRGTYLFLRRHSPTELELMRCLWIWCMISGLESGQPFLSRVYNGRRKLLRPRMVNTTLKLMADHFGFHHVRDSFTSHSLRIGGATTLSASGINRETIQRIGGWSVNASSSDSIYELYTPRENSNLWSALGSNSNLSVRDVASIIPPSQQVRN